MVVKKWFWRVCSVIYRQSYRTSVVRPLRWDPRLMGRDGFGVCSAEECLWCCLQFCDYVGEKVIFGACAAWFSVIDMEPKVVGLWAGALGWWRKWFLVWREQCKVQFSLGSGIAQLCTNQSIARKTYFKHVFYTVQWSPHHGSLNEPKSKAMRPRSRKLTFFTFYSVLGPD